MFQKTKRPEVPQPAVQPIPNEFTLAEIAMAKFDLEAKATAKKAKDAEIKRRRALCKHESQELQMREYYPDGDESSPPCLICLVCGERTEIDSALSYMLAKKLRKTKDD